MPVVHLLQDFVISTIDRPLGLQIPPSANDEPVLRFCKGDSHSDILIPIFHFHMKVWGIYDLSSPIHHVMMYLICLSAMRDATCNINIQTHHLVLLLLFEALRGQFPG